MDQFSWDNKYAGVQLKATKLLLSGEGGDYGATLEAYRVKAEYFLCAALQKNGGGQIQKSPGGMFWIQDWNNMQYVTTAAFLLTVASDYYEAAHATLKYCSSAATNAEMLAAGKEQVDYILGKNGRGTSYLVGFGPVFPQRVHHRGASLPVPVSCQEGFARYYYVQTSNPHVILGAITGGPDANDNYNDQRDEYGQSEPCTYNTAPVVGVFARLNVGSSLASSAAISTIITPQDRIGKQSSATTLPSNNSPTFCIHCSRYHTVLTLVSPQ
jgi:endoglucanase